MNAFHIDLKSCPAELQAGLAEIIRERADRFSDAGTKVQLEPARDEKTVSAIVEAKSVTIRYPRMIDAFRALGRLLGQATLKSFNETPKFDMLGVMIDVSRNGVLLPEAARTLLRRCALMGINVMMLYSEDTYEVPGEPYFGYLRGRYSQAELRELDQYANALGIEMFPCIQALGHLEQILQWPVYKPLEDVKGVLIAEEEQTYALVEKMITAASAPFKSKRIHVGMDEAHGVGTGKYKDKHGAKPPFDVLNTHLNRVRQICEKQGLRPMIWSDMYFRLGSKNNDYYDKQWSIPPQVVKDIPKDVQLVYWDYYHNDQAFYEEWIDHHRKLGSEPVMAGGVWTWNRLWASLPVSFLRTKSCMDACRIKNLKEVFVTMWGDDGMECDIFSALPGMQYFADLGYGDASDDKTFHENFRGAAGFELGGYVKASGIDTPPGVEEPKKCEGNISKLLLWQDPLLSIIDPQMPQSPRNYYLGLAEELTALSRESGNARLCFPAQVAKVLGLKCELHQRLVAAYEKQDRKALQSILDGDLAELRTAVDTLWKIHREMWLATYKPFGLEVIENRYGGLRTRLESVALRLQDYIARTTNEIAELQEPLLKVLPVRVDNIPNMDQGRVKTPSFIK
jgi:hexosaminidase